jgi:hypothetical protein
MKFLTWDVAVLAALALLVAYSLLIRRHKALATLVSVYVAYFVAVSWGDKVSQLLSGDKPLYNQVWIQAHATPYATQGALLVLFTLLISSFLKLGGKRSRYSSIEVVAYSICTVAVAFLFILLFLPSDVRTQVLAISRIAAPIYAYRDWVMMVPVAALLYFGIYGEEEI